MRKQHLFPQDCLEKQEAYERLCRDRRSRCSADSQFRKWSDSKDQHRIQHNIEDKPATLTINGVRLFPAAVKSPVKIAFR